MVRRYYLLYEYY